MATLFRWLASIWGILYIVALGLFLVGNFGLFGTQSGPLAGVLLVPLGLPWNWLVDVFPEPAWPWLAAATPALNVAILYLAAKVFDTR